MTIATELCNKVINKICVKVILERAKYKKIAQGRGKEERQADSGKENREMRERERTMILKNGYVRKSEGKMERECSYGYG